MIGSSITYPSSVRIIWSMWMSQDVIDKQGIGEWAGHQ